MVKPPQYLFLNLCILCLKLQIEAKNTVFLHTEKICESEIQCENKLRKVICYAKVGCNEITLKPVLRYLYKFFIKLTSLIFSTVIECQFLFISSQYIKDSNLMCLILCNKFCLKYLNL